MILCCFFLQLIPYRTCFYALTIEGGRILKAHDYLLINRTPRIITICGDNDSPELLASNSPVPDVIIHEATYTDDILRKVGAEVQHSCAKNIARFAQSIAVKNLVLTHFSARYKNDRDKSPSINEIYTEARKYYSGNLFLANDFDIYHLDKMKTLSLV